MQTGGMASGLVAQYAGHLQQLDSTATAAGVSYHLTELPQAPPPPPPVTDIVDDGATAPTDGSGQPGDEKPDKPGDSHDATQTDAAGSAPRAPASDGDPLADVAADPLLGGDAAGSPMGGDPMQQIAPMAAMLPSALAGALGGAMGAVTSVPQQVGQQVMGAAQQIMQGAASSMEKPEDLGLDADPLSDAGLSDLGSGGLGSGGGVAAVAARSQPGWTRRCRREAGRLPPRRHPREERHQSWRAAEPCMHPPQPHPQVPGWGWE